MPPEAATVTLEQELLDATSQEAQREGEDRQNFLARLVRASNGLGDKEYGKMTEPAQAWVNTGVDSLAGKKDIAEFPDAAEQEMKPARKKLPDADAPAAAAPAARPKAPAAAKAPEAKTPAAPKAPKAAPAPKEKRVLATDVLRQAVLRKPTAELKDYMAEVEKAGKKLSEVTAGFTIVETRKTLAMLKEMGWGKLPKSE